jgi:hypothetical protein
MSTVSAWSSRLCASAMHSAPAFEKAWYRASRAAASSPWPRFATLTFTTVKGTSSRLQSRRQKAAQRSAFGLKPW